MNILMVGGAGFRNSGDEALLRACVQVCREFAPTARLTLAANNADVARDTLRGHDVTFAPSPRFAFFRGDPHYVTGDAIFKSRWAMLRDALIVPSANEARRALAESPDLDFIDRAQSLEFWDALEQADALVVHGGGILTSATRSRLWEQALTVELATSLGKRVLLRSQQIGPFTDKADEDRIKTILRRASYVSARDFQQSAREMFKLTGEAKVRDQVDDALILRTVEPPQPVIERYDLTPENYICVGYRDNAGVGVGSNVLRRTADVVQRAYETFRLPIVLLPQGPFDAPALEQLAALAQAPCRLVRPEDSFRDPIAIAAHARLMIACPHHSLIFALRGGAPVLSPAAGEYYLFKNKGSMRFFDLENYVFDVEAANYLDVASEKLAAIFAGEVDLRRRIAVRVDELRAQAAANDLDFARILLGLETAPVARPY